MKFSNHLFLLCLTVSAITIGLFFQEKIQEMLTNHVTLIQSNAIFFLDEVELLLKKNDPDDQNIIYLRTLANTLLMDINCAYRTANIKLDNPEDALKNWRSSFNGKPGQPTLIQTDMSQIVDYIKMLLQKGYSRDVNVLNLQKIARNMQTYINDAYIQANVKTCDTQIALQNWILAFNR